MDERMQLIEANFAGMKGGRNMGSEGVSGITAMVRDRKKEFRNIGNDEVEKLLKDAMSQVEGVTRFFFLTLIELRCALLISKLQKN